MQDELVRAISQVKDFLKAAGTPLTIGTVIKNLSVKGLSEGDIGIITGLNAPEEVPSSPWSYLVCWVKQNGVIADCDENLEECWVDGDGIEEVPEDGFPEIAEAQPVETTGVPTNQFKVGDVVKFTARISDKLCKAEVISTEYGSKQRLINQVRIRRYDDNKQIDVPIDWLEPYTPEAEEA